MSDYQRRDFLRGAAFAAAAATLVGTRRADAGDPSFMNNVPDPLLSGHELPAFKFELEKSKGKVIAGSYGKDATVEQLPISKGIAGVSMKLEPGAMRELHSHRLPTSGSTSLTASSASPCSVRTAATGSRR